jgi:hypothetical protein
MSLTIQDWQNQIIYEVGAALPDVKPALDVIVPRIQLLWDMWGAKAQQGPYLQYLYARLSALDAVIGQFRNLTNANLGVLNPRLGEKVDRLANVIWKNWYEELLMWQKILMASRSGYMGLIARTGSRSPPIPPPVFGDPNDPMYRGDALTRST